MRKKTSSSDSFTLLSGLSQKINAPLRSLLLSSQKLLDTYKAKNFEYISYKDFRQLLVTLEQINRQIKHCYEATQRLSGLNQSKMLKEFCNINDVIQDILGLFKQEFSGHKIKCSVRLQANIPQVTLSRLDGHQIIHNVLTNALQAMPGGGHLKIKTALDSKSNFIVVDISDEGVGINPEHLPRIFEPFFTTKEHGIEKSSGLGLSIVQSIVQAAGGSINIQSSLRKGTQVRIFLPAASV